MKKIIMISGGCHSGKSSFAQKIAESLGQDILYIATAAAFEGDFLQELAVAQNMRPASWHAVNQYNGIGTSLAGLSGRYDAAIIDSFSSLAQSFFNEFWTEPMADEDITALEVRIVAEVEGILHSQYSDTLIIITNEMGLGTIPATQMSRAFREIVGRLNHRLQLHATEFYFMVSGVPLRMK